MHIDLMFDQRIITIKLFDDPTIKKWFDHFGQINQQEKYRVRTWLADIGSRMPPKSRPWQDIKNTVEQIKNLGFCVPFELPDHFDGQQKTLNMLHRFFTYNVLWYHDNWQGNCPNPFDPNFALPKDIDFQQWLNIIDMINESVHDLEYEVEPTDNMRFLRDNFPILSLVIEPSRNFTDLDPWLNFDETDLAHNYRYFDYNQDLVLLSSTILGKSVLQSFHDNDDVNAKDCTGRLGSFGGVVIDLNQNRKKLYQSPQFHSWAQQQGRTFESLPLEFPIGYINDLQSHQSWLQSNYRSLRSINFVAQ